MYRGIPSINKHLKKRQQQRNRIIHLDHLKNIKPIQFGEEALYYPLLNNRKKQLVQQTKYTEIQRQNRILLQKITQIFTKRHSYGTNAQLNKISRSLNVSLRKKQLQDIELSNAKLLKRLQQRKSQYQVQKMRKDWKRQKQVIKNIANFPVTIFKPKKKGNMTLYYDKRGYDSDRKKFNIDEIYEIIRNININEHNFDVRVRLDKLKLLIIAQNKQLRQKKVIQVERGEALSYLRNECNNQLQNIFSKLKYEQNVLFLISDNLEIQNDFIIDIGQDSFRNKEQTSLNIQQTNIDKKGMTVKQNRKSSTIDIDKFEDDQEQKIQNDKTSKKLLKTVKINESIQRSNQIVKEQKEEND